jgi:hypothetical protein
VTVLTPVEARDLFVSLGMLTATVTLEQWVTGAWAALPGWTARSMAIGRVRDEVDFLAHVPAVAVGALPLPTVPLRATVTLPGMAPGPYAARIRRDPGGQALVYQVDLRWLRQRCVIQRKGSGAARDSWNARTDAWGQHLQDVPCLARPAATPESERPEGIVVTLDTIIELGREVDISPADRVVLDGRVFEVVSVPGVGVEHTVPVRTRGR